MSELWAVETGDYENRHMMFVADSPELATTRIHETYPGFYNVAWEKMVDTSWDSDGEHYREFTVVGHFPYVPGHCSEHDAEYKIAPIEWFRG